MINVLISGALGKMGKNVYSALESSEKLCACCGVDVVDNFSNVNFPIYDNFNKVDKKVDVIIDFSSPLALDKILDFCLANNCPAILCATGYKKEDIEKINEASKKVALFRSANMSLGVNVLLDVITQTAKALYGFDVEIIEKHHNNKVDAPSGTALMFADAVKKADDSKFYVYGREGIVGKRNEKEIGIHAIRGGNIVGEHQVIFAGNDETVTITHQATDRKVFALGAVRAAEFIYGKTSGLYNMADVLAEIKC